jgi:hypothetical protein
MYWMKKKEHNSILLLFHVASYSENATVIAASLALSSVLVMQLLLSFLSEKRKLIACEVSQAN